MAKYNIEGLKKEYQDNGWELRADKYENLSTLMECICPEGHTCHMTYDKWRKSKECPQCAAAALKKTKENEVIPKSRGIKRTLALDQATNVTGWAVFDNEKLVSYGVFKNKEDKTEIKINNLKHWFSDMCAAWKVDRLIFEDIQLQNFEGGPMNTIGVTTFQILAQLQGVLIDVAVEEKLPFKLAHTGVWRKYNDIKGKSRADKKKSAQLLVKNTYSREVSQDEADAICIGRYGLTLFKELTFSNWE